jgi:hypothetical protein
MARVWIDTSFLRPFHRITPILNARAEIGSFANQKWKPGLFRGLAIFLGALLIYSPIYFDRHFTATFRSPVRMFFQSPLVISPRVHTESAVGAKSDQHHSLSTYQQYACEKFGPDCRVALAIQRVENPSGECEIYHHNPDGTLDWGYFQINTVHLKRPGINLRDLLDCKKNIDFAYALYRERGSFAAWSTYTSGAYRRALRN